MALLRSNHRQLAVGFVIIVALAVAGSLAWAFYQQLVLVQKMHAEEIRLEQAVTAEQTRHDELAKHLEYVKSDEYAERWARDEIRMTKPGEVAVVLPEDTAEAFTPDVEPAHSPVVESRSFLTRLWEWVSGPFGRP